MPHRLAIVLSHPVQYYSPWFCHLASVSGITLRVFYLWNFGVTHQHDRQFGKAFSWDVDLLSGYDSEFVPNRARNPGTHHFLGLYNPTLNERIKAWRPDAILVFGYAYRTHLSLLLRRPAPLIFRGDSHLLGHGRPSWLKQTLLRWVFGRCKAVTYVGQSNRDYFRTFGVPESRLHFVPHCVDGARFQRTPEVAAAAAAKISSIGLSGRRIVLYAGKLIADKQPAALLKAFTELSPKDAALVFVGEGDQRDALEACARNHPDLKIVFLPFSNQSAMPVIYAMADIFVLPSRGIYETWGLAVNEAMHLGVPCLVSDRVGCQRDLVIDGLTGWVFPAADTAALRPALERALISLASDAQGYRTRALEKIELFSYERSASSLQKVLAGLIPL